MSSSGLTTKDKKAISPQLRGETIAYAVQNGISTLAANFYEPYINHRIQRHFAGGDTAGYGNYTQNLAGEFAGDLIGSTTLILAETVCPEQLHRFTRAARNWIDPLYTSVAHTVLASEKNKPAYGEKIEQWKTFQERNLVRSAIMMTAGIAGNLAMQKLIAGNPSPTKLIFLGKLASAAVTTTLGLSMRLAFPEQFKSFDKWLGKKIAPLFDVKRTPGAEHCPPQTHADKLITCSDPTASPTR